MSLEEAGRWPELLAIVRREVKPERDKVNREAHRKYWWHFGDKRPAMFAALSGRDRCLVTAQVTKHLCFSFQPTGRVFSQKLYVFPFETVRHFALLQSRLHAAWTWLLSSTMKTDLNYSASDCFETFPFPTDAALATLDTIGEQLYTARARFMVEANQGLTATYNQLKDPDCDSDRIDDIRHLRALHEDLDRAVLAAYRWSDIAVPPYCPVTDADRAAVALFEDLVIDRLFALNAERAAAERGVIVDPSAPRSAKPKKPKSPRARRAPRTQTTLLDDE